MATTGAVRGVDLTAAPLRVRGVDFAAAPLRGEALRSRVDVNDTTSLNWLNVEISRGVLRER